MPLRVANWRKYFETAKSRTTYARAWGSYPLKSGVGYCRLIHNSGDRVRGAALYGAWMALISVLHRQPGEVRSGFLTEDGKPDGNPLTPETLELVTRIPAELFEDLLKIVSSPSMAWLVDTEDHAEPEKEDAKEKPDKPSLRIQFEYEKGERGDLVGITAEDKAAWSKEYPSVNVDHVLSTARDWFRRNLNRRRKYPWKTLLTFFQGAQDDAGKNKGGTPAQIRASLKHLKERRSMLMGSYGLKYEDGRQRHPDEWAEHEAISAKIKKLEADLTSLS